MAIDARIKVTRELLNNAFIQLLEEKPFSKITVKEICERADINRSTYYAHYDNPYNQFESLKKIFFKRVDEYLGSQRRLGKKLNQTDRIAGIVNVYYENRRLFLVIVNSSTFNELVELVSGYTKTDTFEQWEYEYNTSDIKKEYAFDFVCAGSLKIIYNWLNNEKDIKSKDEIVPLVVELCNNVQKFLEK